MVVVMVDDYRPAGGGGGEDGVRGEGEQSR